MVGTTNLLGYTCYSTADAKRKTTLVDMQLYMNKAAINTDPTAGILASAGLSPLPKEWRGAIYSTFVANTDGLGLNFATVGNCRRLLGLRRHRRLITSLSTCGAALTNRAALFFDNSHC